MKFIFSTKMLFVSVQFALVLVISATFVFVPWWWLTFAKRKRSLPMEFVFNLFFFLPQKAGQLEGHADPIWHKTGWDEREQVKVTAHVCRGADNRTEKQKKWHQGSLRLHQEDGAQTEVAMIASEMRMNPLVCICFLLACFNTVLKWRATDSMTLVLSVSGIFMTVIWRDIMQVMVNDWGLLVTNNSM